MSETPPAKSTSTETRLAELESTVERLNAFDQMVNTAFKQVTEQLKILERTNDRVRKLEKRIEDERTAKLLAHASRIFPKTRTVVFVTKGYFGDNIKYAYLAFCEFACGNNVACHFLTDGKRQQEMLKAAGLPVLSAAPADWSDADAAMLLGAKVVVLADNFHQFAFNAPHAWGMLQGARSIQMWHGIPIKEIGLGYIRRPGDGIVLDELLATAGPYDVFVAPGNGDREMWTQRFAFREFAAVGYPRNDVFFRELSQHDLLNVDRESLDHVRQSKQAGKPVVLYVPTFRDVVSDWFSNSEIPTLAAHAEKNGITLVVNLHPYEQDMLEKLRPRYPAVRFVASGTDIYPLVKYADVLMTDYSSLAFDFLLLDRPLVFYRAAAENYKTSSRPFIKGRENLTPGEVAKDFAELIAATDRAVAAARDPAKDPFRKVRRELRRKLFDLADGKAGHRVCKLIMQQIEAG